MAAESRRRRIGHKRPPGWGRWAARQSSVGARGTSPELRAGMKAISTIWMGPATKRRRCGGALIPDPSISEWLLPTWRGGWLVGRRGGAHRFADCALALKRSEN